MPPSVLLRISIVSLPQQALPVFIRAALDALQVGALSPKLPDVLLYGLHFIMSAYIRSLHRAIPLAPFKRGTVAFWSWVARNLSGLA